MRNHCQNMILYDFKHGIPKAKRRPMHEPIKKGRKAAASLKEQFSLLPQINVAPAERGNFLDLGCLPQEFQAPKLDQTQPNIRVSDHNVVLFRLSFIRNTVLHGRVRGRWLSICSL